MKKKCPDCLTFAQLQSDYPSSFWEGLLSSAGIIRVKRCGNCNAAVFVVLGSFTTTRKRLRALADRVYWLVFVFILLMVGYIIFEAIVS
ncbi:MAG: hypothetical protein M1469_01455 [Bacteroidetes bacterium]|nr:hypothetical protein [Bacteroidota bacterium]